MKHFISLILTTITVFANGSFYLNNSNGILLEDVINNKLQTVMSINGKTYLVNTNNFSLSTSTNSEGVAIFSNYNILKFKENSKLQIDSFTQSVENLNSYPETIKYSENDLQCSLIEGEIELIVNDNIIINTMLATIIPTKGRYFIKVDNDRTSVSIIDGESKILDTISKKEVKLIKGEMVVVIEAPRLTGRNNEIIKKRNLFNVSKIEDDELKYLTSDISKTYELNKNIKFIVNDKNVLGVKIN